MTAAVALALVAFLAVRGAAADVRVLWPIALVIPIFAALPLPGAPKKSGALIYCAFAVASLIVTHAVFFGEDRYHMVATPALCVLAACALRRSDDSPAISA